MYQVAALQEWLVTEGLSEGNMCAAAHFSMVDEGGCEFLMSACLDRASRELALVPEASLHGVCAEAARDMLEAYCENKNLQRACDAIVEFRYVEKWWRANGGYTGNTSNSVRDLLALVNLNIVPSKVLIDVVRPSGLISAEGVWDIFEQRRKIERDGCCEWHVTTVGTFGAAGEGAEQFRSVSNVAVTGRGKDQLVAAVNRKKCCVHVFGYEGGCVTVGDNMEKGQGQLSYPVGVCFNGRGELLVSDFEEHKIFVYSSDGIYLRSIGSEGSGKEQLRRPRGLALGQEGEIIVCDTGNHRVQVLCEDGSHVRSFGTYGTLNGQLNTPCSVGIMSDGGIVVSDLGNARVQVFSSKGIFQRAFGSRGEKDGQFHSTYGVAVGLSGEILVSDYHSHKVQVFSSEGVYLRCIRKGGDSDVDLINPHGVAVDWQGRIFIGHDGGKNVLVLEGISNKQ